MEGRSSVRSRRDSSGDCRRNRRRPCAPNHPHRRLRRHSRPLRHQNAPARRHRPPQRRRCAAGQGSRGRRRTGHADRTARRGRRLPRRPRPGHRPGLRDGRRSRHQPAGHHGQLTGLPDYSLRHRRLAQLGADRPIHRNRDLGHLVQQRMAAKVSATHLQRIFTVVLLAVAAFILADAVTGRQPRLAVPAVREAASAAVRALRAGRS
ncbi:protein of unknown function [Streptomyces murinus]